MTQTERTEALLELREAANTASDHIAAADPPKEVKLTFALEIAKVLDNILSAPLSKEDLHHGNTAYDKGSC